jgi:predicted RNase H-like nuclease (RuvC/YqgF family)
LGKLDPKTGEIIPTGQRGRKKKERPAEDSAQVEARVAVASAGYLEKIQQQELTIRQQQTQIAELNKQIAQMEEIISKAAAILGKERK